MQIKSYSHPLVIVLLATYLFACEQPTEKQSQLPDDGNVIRLKSRSFSPDPGLADELKGEFDKASGGIVHVIVQFHEAPTTQDKLILKREFKTTILDPIPDTAFFASMPSDTSVTKQLLSTDIGLRWIGHIRPTDKIAPALHDGNAPAYSKRTAGKVEFFILFFGDVPVEQQQNVLDELGIEIVDRVVPVNGWRVNMPEKQVFELAERDSVKWIEQGPAPVEEDNDGVRSETGVNANAVIAPNPFNLSGLGVIVAQWESTNASSQHNDLSANIVLADPPVLIRTRSERYNDSNPTNGQFNAGETIYVDIDDDTVVSIGDWRSTVSGGLPAGALVATGDADLTTPTIFFQTLERYDDGDLDRSFSVGETIYLDADGNANSSFGTVSVGDTRVTASTCCAAGTIVAAADGDIGNSIRSFATDPHYHATHVAGTIMGSGAQSVAEGGTPTQWKGVAPATTLRSYQTNGFGADYVDAANSATQISTNSWGTSHHHQQIPPSAGYDVTTGFYDSVISGRQSDGSASGLARQISILGSSGNQGRPERFVENAPANGQFDDGETIILDNDDDGTVSGGDSVRLGATPAIGTVLVNFNPTERHDETMNTGGLYSTGEGIFRDADNSWTVNAGDTRINANAGFAAGTVVAAGDLDDGRFLRQFRQWGNVRVPNSAKDTIVVANLRSDTKVPSPSSSRGPTLDGRIKPDISGPGSKAVGDLKIKSTWPRNVYDSISGTSMSTPAVAGVSSLVTEWYQQNSVVAGPTPATLRGLLIHSAEDLDTIPNVGGGFAGPDYTFGYGRTRADKAVAMVPHHTVGSINAIGAAAAVDYTFTIGSVNDLSATLVWDDPAWTANAAASPATGMLQNDLDLILIAPDGTQHTPWLMNAATPTAPATNSAIAVATPIPNAARDRRNTIEQVSVSIAQPGTWTARVTGSTLNLGPQPFTLVSQFIRPQDSPSVGLAATDVRMRDNVGDLGGIPSTGTMWLSPDLWNRYAQDGLTSHENPEFGQENYLYARIENASATDIARAATVEVWLAGASTGLAWPANFQYVGRFPVANLTAGETRVIGPLAWNPPDPTPSNHFCFYIRVVSSQDPIVFVEGPSVDTNARNSNNIVWRNINVVDLSSSRTVSFQVRNTSREKQAIDLSLQIPSEFLEIGTATVQLPPRFFESTKVRKSEVIGLREETNVTVHPWGLLEDDSQTGETEYMLEPKTRPTRRVQIESPRVVIPGPVLAPGETEVIQLTFGSESTEKQVYDIHVSQTGGGETMGGILYHVRTGHVSENQ